MIYIGQSHDQGYQSVSQAPKIRIQRSASYCLYFVTDVLRNIHPKYTVRAICSFSANNIFKNSPFRPYLWKHKFWCIDMCDTWMERSWKEEQTLQKNICSKINFKESKVEKRFFNFSFLMLPGHIKKSSACSRNAQWWQKTRQNVCRNVLCTIKTNREWNTTNWSVYGPLHSQSRI